MGFENFWHTKEHRRDTLQEEFVHSESDGSNTGLEEEPIEESYEQAPTGLISTSEIFDKEGVCLDEIYRWYAAAISRRDRTPILLDNFVNHFEGRSLDPTFAFGDPKKGYLLGCLKFGVFIPTHFAPKTMRGGYEIMKQLGASKEVPSVMSVTEDLKETISKMESWHVFDLDFLGNFRDELVDKKIVFNSHPDTKYLMFGLVAEYLEEKNEETSDEDQETE